MSNGELEYKHSSRVEAFRYAVVSAGIVTVRFVIVGQFLRALIAIPINLVVWFSVLYITSYIYRRRGGHPKRERRAFILTTVGVIVFLLCGVFGLVIIRPELFV